MAAILALGSALTFGVADFHGGFASRRATPWTVVVGSQFAGLALLVVALPFLPTAVEEADAIFGSDLWAYGIESNRATLEPLMRYAHQQGLTDRLIGIEEAFSPAVQGDA